MDDASIVGLADLDPGRLAAAAAEFGVDRTFTLVSEMVDSMDLDAVLVLTPDAAHHPQSIRCLESGVHVLVEKPPAYTVAETREMAAAADRAGKHLMVGWNRTYALQRVKELFGDEPPDVVVADFVRADPAFLGLLRNHLVDPLYYLCGAPDKIVALGNMADQDREGNTVASVRFAGGSLGQVTLSLGAGGRSERLTAFGNGYSVFIDSTSTGAGRVERGGKVVETLEPLDSIALQIRHFIDCVKDDREPLTSGGRAVEIMEFIQAIMDAAGTTATSFVPDAGDGWITWCGCGDKILPGVASCPNCGAVWEGWSMPVEEVRRA
jgi:virulence factor